MAQTGSYDTVKPGIQDYLASYEGDHKARMASLRACTLWDRNKMETLVDPHPEVGRSFAGLLNAAEVIGALAQFTQGAATGSAGARAAGGRSWQVNPKVATY